MLQETILVETVQAEYTQPAISGAISRNRFINIEASGVM
jgi:hypothetical protein